TTTRILIFISMIPVKDMPSFRPTMDLKLKHLAARTLALALLCLTPRLAEAQLGRTQAHLILSADVARPGDTIMAGVRMQMPEGWHTYWKNSGASGIPTKIEWQLPDGVTAGDIQWPLPEKTPEGEFTTYIYENEVVLLVPLKLAADLKPGPLGLKAHV